MRNRKSEKGQTLLLVAVSLFTLIAMGALAIDLTALYTARGEMQRAADAAALGAAKAFVETGVTTAPNDPELRTLATNIGTAYVHAYLTTATINSVGGVSPQLNGTPNFDFSRLGNPQVTVIVQRTDVPTYFAHIFGTRFATISATATAEAYNSSNPPGGGGAGMPPVAPSCVKPWLIPNEDPDHTGNFVNPATGELLNPGVAPGGIIGEEITLLSDCPIGGAICAPIELPVAHRGGLAQLDYLPAEVAAATGTCSCSGATDYEQSSGCCDSATQYQCGGTTPSVLFGLIGNVVGNTVSSVECLINASGPGLTAGQDEIGLGTGATAPADSFGNFLADNGNDPIEIKGFGAAHGGMAPGSLVNTSPSIVTLPIYDDTGVAGYILPVKIIGFMQAFIEQTQANGSLQIYVLNISGCGPNVTATLPPVSGGGASPVPVRLIHQ